MGVIGGLCLTCQHLRQVATVWECVGSARASGLPRETNVSLPAPSLTPSFFHVILVAAAAVFAPFQHSGAHGIAVGAGPASPGPARLLVRVRAGVFVCLCEHVLPTRCVLVVRRELS